MPELPGRGGPSKVGAPSSRPGSGFVKRHRKAKKDTIRGITKNDIKRLARRGGVKRISHLIYDDIREAMVSRLRTILEHCVVYVEYRNATTVTIYDVMHSLRRLGRPIYGFDPETYQQPPRRRRIGM